MEARDFYNKRIKEEPTIGMAKGILIALAISGLMWMIEKLYKHYRK